MFSLKGAWNHLRICPSKTVSQGLLFWSCNINFSLLISMNHLSSHLLALLHHQHILKCNSIVFITSHCISSLFGLWKTQEKKPATKKESMQAHWIYHFPLEMHPFFRIKVKILLVRTFSECKRAQHSPMDSWHTIQQKSCWLLVWSFLWCAQLTLQPQFSSFLLTFLVQSLKWGNCIDILI